MSEQSTCPECGHVEEAADRISVTMLMTAHLTEEHWTAEDERKLQAQLRNPDAWYD